MRLPQHHSDFGILILFCNIETIQKSSKSSLCRTMLQSAWEGDVWAWWLLGREMGISLRAQAVLLNIDSALLQHPGFRLLTAASWWLVWLLSPNLKSWPSQAVIMHCTFSVAPFGPQRFYLQLKLSVDLTHPYISCYFFTLVNCKDWMSLFQLKSSCFWMKIWKQHETFIF